MANMKAKVSSMTSKGAFGGKKKGKDPHKESTPLKKKKLMKLQKSKSKSKSNKRKGYDPHS